MRGWFEQKGRWVPGYAVLAMLAGCVAPSASPPPRPVPAPVPIPAPRPAAPATTDWRDIKLTPGAWTYGAQGGGSEARYGPAGAPPLFLARCDRARRSVTLWRSGPATGSITVTTSSAVRALPTQAGAATLSATDPFLDAMAFSRGRFVVAGAGEASLYIPAWPEFARVVEDCRG